VFPLAYSIILSALYVPITVMLLALVFRGVAFEFRWKTKRGQFLWDWAFAGGSTLAAFAQGIALGALVQGIPVAGRAYAGGWWDWLTPFSLLTGIALVIGYALLGATWLIWRAENDVQDKAYKMANRLAPATLALIGVVSLWTPFINSLYLDRWFAWPQLAFVAPVPLAVLAAGWFMMGDLRSRREARPFLLALALFVLCFIGLGISFYPHIVPNSLTIWEAAAPEESLAFLLVGAAVLIPMILAYTAYSYWVFRGKVNAREGYR
jgi:cytochrome d ubiquinol oxidase subunit II